jgi:hypothetical protein
LERREGDRGLDIGIVKKVKTLERGQRNLIAKNAKIEEREKRIGSRTRILLRQNYFGGQASTTMIEWAASC